MESQAKHQEGPAEVLTVNEVCEALRLGRTVVNSHLWDGTLPIFWEITAQLAKHLVANMMRRQQ